MMRVPLVLLLAAAPAAPSPAPAPAAEPCKGVGTAIVVDTAQRRMFRCRADASLEELTVALGSGGVGKTRQGDAKVPVGAYALGPPRASRSYKTFIPVGYPTADQRRRGYTGSAVGVHGPARGWEHLPSAANTSVDWTLGCIAVGSDEEIDRVSRWVKDDRVARIVIR